MGTAGPRCFSASGSLLLPLLAAGALALIMTATHAAQGQTFSVLHSFEVSDGAEPFAGPTLDAAGDLYGTTQYGGRLDCDEGGVPGCGVAYRLKKRNSIWTFSVLHEFKGRNGNFLPTYPGQITFSPRNVLFGAQVFGGNDAGILYDLHPPATPSGAESGLWRYHIEHTYGNGNDGGQPGPIVFDPSGNIFGAEADGGPPGAAGLVYELTPSSDGWNETILYAFQGGSDGSNPWGVALDPSGKNIFGVTSSGGNQQCYNNVGCGTVYELKRSGSKWTKTTLHVFQQDTEGGDPGPLLRDRSGNLFGVTGEGASGNGGTIWELSPSGSGWVFKVLYTFPWPTEEFTGPSQLVMGADGTFFGVNNGGGAHGYGSVFRLESARGRWKYTDLYSFNGGADGCYPRGPVALAPNGNIYGTTQECAEGYGNVWEVAP